MENGKESAKEIGTQIIPEGLEIVPEITYREIIEVLGAHAQAAQVMENKLRADCQFEQAKSVNRTKMIFLKTIAIITELEDFAVSEELKNAVESEIDRRSNPDDQDAKIVKL